MSANLREKNESATIINGAVLTGKSIEAIKWLQENNNAFLAIETSLIADVVCFIGTHLDEYNEPERARGIDLIKGLAQTRGWINDLHKP